MFLNTAAFLLGGGLLHALYYRRRSAAEEAWKYQPGKGVSRAEAWGMLPLVLLNAVIVNGAIGGSVALILGGHTRAFFTLEEHSAIYAGFSTVAVFVWYHVMLYYWHRRMHQPDLFRRFHHVHHKHKAPIWLDALYEHPLEAAWGGVVILTPLFLFPIWAYGYFLFLAVMGAHEVLDHAGIKLDLPVPLLSSSRGHDEHHRRSNVYFGQLLPLLDRLHKTTQVNARGRDGERPATRA